MSQKIKAKVLEYYTFYQGIYCGQVELELLDGEDKGKIIKIQVVNHYKVGDIIDVLESTI
jgi:ribosomal protein S28E/S33